MKKTFVRSWKGSVQPRKQRKFRYHAPLHIRRHFLGVHLSPELRKNYGKRSIPVRKGDHVKIIRGQFKGKLGAVRGILLRRGRVQVEGIEVAKADGGRKPFPLHPSNLLITALHLENPKRKKKLELNRKKLKGEGKEIKEKEIKEKGAKGKEKAQ